MRTIWKFPLEILDEQVIDMPYGAQILSVHLQNNVPTLWAIVETTREIEKREILMRGTGHPAGEIEHSNFIGTVILPDTGLVFHIFDK